MRLFLALALLAAAPAAQARVTAVGSSGFSVQHEVRLSAAPAAAWARLIQPRLWWSPDHTFGHDSARLSLSPQAGGCFCETLPEGGSVEHMHVVYAAPGKALRMTGGLGPLQAVPVSAVMTVTLKPDGAGTALSLRYDVSGPLPGEPAQIAAAVDGVLREQVERLAASTDEPAS